MPRLIQTRAAETTALGIFAEKTIDLPKPGGPEVLTGFGCAGSCGCKKAKCGGQSMGHDGLSGVVDDVRNLSTAGKIALGVAVLTGIDIVTGGKVTKSIKKIAKRR